MYEVDGLTTSLAMAPVFRPRLELKDTVGENEDRVFSFEVPTVLKGNL